MPFRDYYHTGLTFNIPNPPAPSGNANLASSIIQNRTWLKPAMAGMATTGLLLPLYQYPSFVYSNTAINGLLDLIKSNSDVPVLVVINSGNGPGPLDGNFTALINRLHGAGARVLAYVHTTYAQRAIGDVEADVQTWLLQYPTIDGLFVDEMDNSGSDASVKYYTDLTNYAHSYNLYPVVSNPGALLPQPYFVGPASDILVIYENTTYPAESILKGDYAGGFADYDPVGRAGIVYNMAHLDIANVSMMKKYLGWIYVTDDGLPNPYLVLPSYLAALFNLLKRGGDATSVINTIGVSGASQTLNWSSLNKIIYDVTLTADCTFSFGTITNTLQESQIVLYLRQDSTAGHQAILPNGIKWSGGVAPTRLISAGNVYRYTFVTSDGGTNIFGF